MLSIIITNYKTPELLKICLKSIQKNCEGIENEVIIVDAESVPETALATKEILPQAKFIPFEENVGYAKLVNRGILESSGDYILVINSDIILPPPTTALGRDKADAGLEKIVEFMQKNPEVGLVGPQLLNFNGSVQDSCFSFPNPLTILARRTLIGKLPFAKKAVANFLMKNFNHQTIREVDWVMGSALFIKRVALEKVDLMDERFFMYFEDVDWCRRFWQAGFKVVYFPQVKMYHYHLRASRKSGGLLDLFVNRYTWIHIFSAIKYFIKNGLKNIA